MPLVGGGLVQAAQTLFATAVQVVLYFPVGHAKLLQFKQADWPVLG